MIERDAVKFLYDLGKSEQKIIKTESGTYTTENLQRVTAPLCKSLVVHNLSSLVDFIEENIDKYQGEYLVQVKDPETVELLKPLNNDGKREKVMVAEALLPRITLGNYMDVERFNIMLQTNFVENEHRARLLKLTGLLKDETVKQYGDDGISQKVSIKTGITTEGEAQVPNPVELAPYRTFPEIQQPESKFIFRMQTGAEACLYEADGGAWRNKAMKNIRDYLEEKLKENDKVKIIS